MNISISYVENGLEDECNTALAERNTAQYFTPCRWMRVVDATRNERPRIFFVGHDHGDVIAPNFWMNNKMEPIPLEWDTPEVGRALENFLVIFYTSRISDSLNTVGGLSK